jgi:hypothetical protein
VKTTSVEDPDAYDTAQLTIVSGNGTGLPASYSTGTRLLEGPIFHGWWWPCTSTDYNLYQGECTAVDSCPVNMHLRWVSPGGVRRPIAKSYL